MLDFKKLRRYIIYLTVGILIVAACVSVAAVLMGTVNDAIAKTYETLFWSLVHCLIMLALIWDDNSMQDTYGKLPFFVNTLFFIVAMSFIASVLKIWGVVPWDTFNNFYKTFATVAFASLHGEILSKAAKKKNYLDNVIYINFIFIIVVLCLLQLQIYINNVGLVFGPMFYRLLAAASIIDGTLSILVIIFFKLYKYNNPEVGGGSKGQWDSPTISILILLLVIYLVFQILVPIIGFSAFMYK